MKCMSDLSGFREDETAYLLSQTTVSACRVGRPRHGHLAWSRLAWLRFAAGDRWAVSGAMIRSPGQKTPPGLAM